MLKANPGWNRGFFVFGITAVLVLAPEVSRAATPSSGPTFVSGPTFLPSSAAPLAGTLQLTTDVDSRVSVLASDGTNVWERDFYDYATTHSIPLLGFKPDRTNNILVTVYDRQRNASTAPGLLTFVTAPLPANFPPWTVLHDEPDQMEPGYTLFMVRNVSATIAYIVIMDNSGEVVWYMQCPNFNDADVKMLDNGDLFIPAYQNVFSEINMLGQTVETWIPPAAYPVNVHDGFPTDHGTILYVSDNSIFVTGLPTSSVSNAPLENVNVDNNPLVEISITNSALINAWSPMTWLDPTRITYLTYGDGSGSPHGIDTEHGNAVIEDTNDDSLIGSLRNENAVYKISRAGQLKWILGPHANWSTNLQPYLLNPVGAPFDWNYGQHAPQLTPEGTLMIYNDNNYQACPYAPTVADQSNYSSAVEYQIDETNMQVAEVWNSAWQTNQDRLFTPYVGKVQWLPQTRNVLVTYGAVTYINGKSPSPYSPSADMLRIIEYTHDPVPQVVFDLSVFDYTNTSSAYKGCFGYRAYQISDLYPHPANPVSDLSVGDHYQIPFLEFSADPVHSYPVQASTDLVNWTTIGTAVETGGVGEYEFDDLNAGVYPARFYRIITQ